MKKDSIAMMIYGEINSNKSIFTEEKYKHLANAFLENNFDVESVIYNDALSENLLGKLQDYQAILVWVNPIVNGNNRKRLDALLFSLSDKGCFVSSHPEVILKIGTKEVLYKTRKMDWGGGTRLYSTFDEFKQNVLSSVGQNGVRILKQHRGNGGNGVFKIKYANVESGTISVTHASKGSQERFLPVDEFYREFNSYFADNGMLIDQEWNENIMNGMVRCYVTGNKVSGFGYQEVNALYPGKTPGKRFYFSENCGLFQDLKKLMENNWIPELLEITQTRNDMLPVIWDADFFINHFNSENVSSKYTLCEINVSCVSPFPESSIPYMVEEVKNRIRNR